ncbi:MAG: thioredoxin domain-containing protein [Saprospiraceae bacterium]|nr:thioredoxin domain-containing protein [Saprospiraceae bacterium]
MKTIPEDAHLYTNALIEESSPYLLQHAHNPVNWEAWNEATLKRAKEEGKMLIVSIGYSACHWCHVMEHESFEDPIVAGLMNDHFIPVKVDREERPDIDNIYMTACQLSNQRGCGWPLNAFALPDGSPVWAGTYFPKEQWINILDQFIGLQRTKSPKLQEAAESLTSGIRKFDTIHKADINSGQNITLQIDQIHLIVSDFLGTIDFDNGGRLGQPKFPMPVSYEFLLQYYFHTGDPRTLEAITITLDKMANGGLYDQIGGGFARYSVDNIWLVPHFEKMLYDNSQLISLYAQAYKLTGNELYKNVIIQSLEFIDREMTEHKSGGIYTALDADSEGVEGKFYVWTKKEIEKAINDPYKSNIYVDYFGISEHGNWEENNILYHDPSKFKPETYDISSSELNSLIEECNILLLAERAKRIRPGLDDKILTSWNALMIKAYVDAFLALGQNKYLESAISIAKFITERQMSHDYRLNRTFKNNFSKINGFLDDYAHTISAFISLFQSTFDSDWIEMAKNMTEYVILHFYDQSSGLFFYTSDIDPQIVARKMELQDNVIPSSNSVMARNLHYLGAIFDKKEYHEMSVQMFINISEQLIQSRQPSFYANWCRLMIELTIPSFEVVITGPDALKRSLEMQKEYLPNAIFVGSQDDKQLPLLQGKSVSTTQTNIFVCVNKTCQLPVTETSDALNQVLSGKFL